MYLYICIYVYIYIHLYTYTSIHSALGPSFLVLHRVSERQFVVLRHVAKAYVCRHTSFSVYIYMYLCVCRHGASANSRQLYTHLNSKIFVCFAMERASGSVKKLDKTALEALDSRTETTKVPEEDLLELDQEEADPPSENETFTSTKRSNCKPESHRGPARRAKQARKALVFKGLLTKEEADKLGIDQLDEMVKSYRHKGGSSMLNEAVLKQLEENQKENLMGRLFTEHLETPEMRLPEINEIQVRRANQVLLASMEMCPFCKKVLDTNHLNNKNHLAYMKEHLQSHYMLDPGFEMTSEEVKGTLNPKP